MADTETRERLAQRVAERRKVLSERESLDPRIRALSRSSARHLLPPRPQPTRGTIPMALFAVLGVLALLTCVGLATAAVYGSAWLQGTLNDPSTTVQSFYGALEQKDYARAYTYFSDHARAQVSEPAFAARFASYDAIDGPVTSYVLSAPRYAPGGAAATMSVTAQRQANTSTPEVHTLSLVKQAGAWRIAGIVVSKNPASAPTPVK
ncbi:MAG TPA: hypothetical protein VGN32_16070 [Ktedonobacterales bacterium]|jgi:hypothetical protein|nr:hypothetical protein [Ktedonobacterales bacterium]